MKLTIREKVWGMVAAALVAVIWSTMAVSAGASGTHSHSQAVVDARVVAGAAAQQAAYEDDVELGTDGQSAAPSVASEFVTQFAALSDSVRGTGQALVDSLTLRVARIYANWIYYDVSLVPNYGNVTNACAKVSTNSLRWSVTSGKCRA